MIVSSSAIRILSGRLSLRREPGPQKVTPLAASSRRPVLRTVPPAYAPRATSQRRERAHAGNTTSARSPGSLVSSSVPWSSSRTSARTIERPVPVVAAVEAAAVVGDRERDVAVALRQLDPHSAAAVLERVLEQLAEDERERGRALAGEGDRLELGLDLLAGDEALDEHRAEPLDQLGEVDVVLAVLGQHLVHGGDREDPVDGVAERLLRIRVRRPRLQPQQRGDRLQVVLDAVVDLLGEHAAHHRAPVLERDRGVMRDRLEQRAVVVGERRVPVADELADLAALPAQRQAQRVRARAALGPGDLPVLEHERRAGRADRRHRRLHDRLERLLEVERLRDRLRDPRERLELVDAPLRVGVELRVLDRLRDLRRDRDEQVDLRLGVLPRRARADVERALELLARQDRHRQDRLVLVLGQVREELEARVEVGARGDRDRRPLGRGGAGDPLAGPHPRPPRHLLDAGAVRRAQHELVRPLVVEVDEAGVGLERLGDLAGDELEHLFEIERRVDRGDRLGQQPEVPCGGVHRDESRSPVRRHYARAVAYKLLTQRVGETSRSGNRFYSR